MNNFFNFYLPTFQTKYGTDWDDFLTIIEDNIDESINKTYQFYWLNDPNKMNVQVVEKVLNSLKIPYTVTDTLAVKKMYIRKFLTSFREKGLEDMYLDPQERIVGTRGVIYLGPNLGSWRWNYSRWHEIGGASILDDIKWSSSTSKFKVFIDCKTVDSDMLDEIVAIYRQNFMLPAFYQIYLIDSTFAILRTV